MRKILCFLLAIAAAVSFVPSAQTASVPETSAKAAILIDAHSGRVLYEKNADEALLIASTTKVMTAYLALQMAGLDETVTIKREDTLVDGTRVYFKAGDKFSMRELLIGLLLQSGNDAALAIARYCGKGDGVDGFVAAMNAAAKTLGLTHSGFTNPHGLNDNGVGNRASARDMATLTAAAAAIPGFLEITSMKTGKVGQQLVQNHNKMLWKYEDANGFKTGYTQKAGRCLISGALRGGQQLIAVTLNDPNDWEDHINMLNYGFETFPERRLCTRDAFLAELPIVSGLIKRIDVRVRDTVAISMTETETADLRVDIELPRFVFAPVSAGQTVGIIRFYAGEKCVGQSELYAAGDAAEIEIKGGLWNAFKKLLRLGD